MKKSMLNASAVEYSKTKSKKKDTKEEVQRLKTQSELTEGLRNAITQDKIDKLSVGQEFKNYKELCEALSIPEVTSDSKKAQMKELERFVLLKRNGQKFIIEDIYNKPLDKDDDRYGIFTKCIEFILMYNFAHPGENRFFAESQDGETYAFFKTVLWKSLGLVNEMYGIRFDQIRMNPNTGEVYDPFRYHPEVTARTIEMFYSVANSKLTRIMERALNSMKSRFILDWCYESRIEYRDEDNEHHSRVMTADEHKRYLTLENNIMVKKYNCKSMFQLAVSNKLKSFYEDVEDAIYEQFGWDKVITKIRVIASEEAAETTYNFIESDFMREHKHLLNEAVQERLISEAESSYNKARDKYEEYIETHSDEYKKYIHDINEVKKNLDPMQSLYENFLKDPDGDVFEITVPFIERPKDMPFKYPASYLMATKILVNELIKFRDNSKAMDIISSAYEERMKDGEEHIALTDSEISELMR